ncbi:Ribosomal small subunit pseudouridine synthase A [Pseudomonas sp. THAF187a]|uniref:pseudouridine synthase n=1 Tax=Pseudomonadaceae TaxID=135621 RepID=UPI0012683A76|nr:MULTISPECIES: pseudouridine synthase [unclassified Pseudomonas]QFT21289.1 Ribosomal small subunit pseudouridine synthase A [Pseudomonas sp. THAF187a]QFT41477.1 Ribosomal small subunit pseudouridine synthase A [Pseudomonas sp. THAF42]WFC61686.1 pseudouridine synthase [Pseudomonas sp. REST10]|tara:strand:+ start:1970 stop:2662 length:693 start_codon:yes stop_codon:yes gene_type:complete
MRLDRFLSNFPRFSRQDSRLLVSAGRVRVDGAVVRDPRSEVRDFQRVELDDELLQAGRSARYWMLHKPVGVVSATEHEEHRTVLDLLDEPDKHDLHLAGRLDLGTSGLLLITNDGRWSRRITQPQQRKPKVYHVTTEQPITDEYAEVFARGLYFAFEDLTTLPAQLELLDSHRARLTLFEGRYHQVKRMFGHFRNRVVALHRESMGEIVLDPQLAPGQYRALTATEIASV